MSVVRSSLERLTVDGRLHLVGLAGQLVSDLRVGRGYPLYKCGVTDVLERRGLSAAVLSRWQFPLLDPGNRAIALADLVVKPDTDELRFSGVYTGSVLTSLAALHECAEGLEPPDGGKDWSLRVLRIPSLFISALWLHDEQQIETLPSNGDYLRVLATTASYDASDRLMTWQEVLSALEEPARRHVTLDGTPPPVTPRPD
jgi:hypothetical protein